MKEQINIQNLSEMKNFIEENNESLRNAILALEILSLQQPDQEVQQPQTIIPQRNYPGYTTPPRFGFMSQKQE